MSAARTASSSRWRQDDGRLRVWLRVLIVVVVMFVAVGLTQTTMLWLERTPAHAMQAVLVLTLVIPLFAWLTRRLDHRDLGSYGMRLDRGPIVFASVGLLVAAFLGVRAARRDRSPGRLVLDLTALARAHIQE